MFVTILVSLENGKSTKFIRCKIHSMSFLNTLFAITKMTLEILCIVTLPAVRWMEYLSFFFYFCGREKKEPRWKGPEESPQEKPRCVRLMGALEGFWSCLKCWCRKLIQLGNAIAVNHSRFQVTDFRIEKKN